MNEMFQSAAPNQAITTGNDVTVRRIVVAVDLLEHSKKTALYAIALAKGFGASITFVHVFPGETTTESATEAIHRRYEQERDIGEGAFGPVSATNCAKSIRAARSSFRLAILQNKFTSLRSAWRLI